MRKPLTAPATIITLAMLWLATGTFAQKAPDYETLSTAQGLSQGMVFDMLQDKDGFIWVATKEGLNRYDGYSFRVFTNDPYNPYSLSSNSVSTLFEDSKERIWIGTLDAGLNVYDKKTGEFRRIMYRPGDPGGLSGNRIRANITELPDGRILVLPENKILNIISLPGNYFEKDTDPVITSIKLPGNEQAYGVGMDNKGEIWIGCTDKKVYMFNAAATGFELISDGKTFSPAITKAGTILWTGREMMQTTRRSVARPFDTASGIVKGFFTRDDAGKILIGSMGAIPPGAAKSYVYDMRTLRQGMPFQEAESCTFASALINLGSLMVDRSGIIWAGTSGFGLHKYNLAAARFHHLVPGFSVRDILPVGNGGLYLAGWNSDKWVSKVNPLPGVLIANQFKNFIVSQKGDYWIWKDETHLLKYDTGSKKLSSFPISLRSSDDMQPLLEDKRGNIWVCGLSGSLIRVDPGTGMVSSFNVNNKAAKPMLTDALCTAFYEDEKGVFWMGTEEGFVKISFNGNNNAQPAITWYKNNAADRNSLNYNHVSCFLDDPGNNNYLWICTKGGGLNRLNKSTGDFLHLTTKDGLPNDVVYGILPDTSGNIWGSTNKGIFCLLANKNKNNTGLVFRNFTKDDGLQGDEFNTSAFARMPNGELAFGGVNGLNTFNPAEVLYPGFSPNVFITNILVGNQPVLPNDKTGVLQQSIEHAESITLNHLQDILTLEFSSLDFSAPAKNKYRYQLVGVDKEWVESGTRRAATYLHLPAGKYIFKVQGSNSQGIWSDKIARLQITVLPPWWRSWWTYLCYILLLVFGIRAYFKFSVNRAKLKAQLNFEIREAKRVKELDLVKTQLYTNITHEFRTPLTVILGMAQQVKNNPAVHLQNGTDMIIRNGENLLKLVNEMLDLSKLETGKMSLQQVKGDIINFLRYIVESFQSLAESQQKQLHFLSGIDELHTVYDPEKIRQIITNLLSNALKFTPQKGNIYISINNGIVPDNEHRVTLIIKVKDTGIGIPEGELEYIFDRFYQLDNSHTRKAEGTGIGLALTRELVKLMEGEITVKSPPTGAHKGSEFTVLLPLEKLSVPEETSTYTIAKETVQQKSAVVSGSMEMAGQKQENQKPLILMVEDNADVVAYTASCLPDYRFAVGKDGKEGIEIATGIIPDLIITDVMMPFVDGFELCHRLRNDERTSHIPIIMLTAKADMDSKIEGLEQGADAYLKKPFHREELLLRIKKLLELRQNLQQLYLKKAGLNESAASPAMIADAVITDHKIENAFVKKVREAVEQHITETDFTVEQLCKMIFMSHSQLHRKLDALTGCSPNKFIRMIRLHKARELLQDPANSIASVALDCGYNDPGYFARVFKQEYQSTPQEWRINGK